MAGLRSTPSRDGIGVPIYFAAQQTAAFTKERIMSPRSTFSAIGGFVDMVGSAIAASAAVEGGRRPKAGDLRRLGIEPRQFYRIGRN